MKRKFLNSAATGLVVGALMLPATASAQRTRSGAPATGGAVARDPAPASAPPPAASAPPPAASAPASGSGGDSGQRSGGTRTRSGGGQSRAGSGGGGGRTATAAPGSGRTRGDRTPTGRAVPGRPSGGGGGTHIIVPGGYYPWGWGGLGFGGYYAGLYDPWGYDGGYGGYEGGGYQGGYDYDGGLRLKVRPRDASVFIDGYYAGLVDEFDGAFQRLHIDSGPHRVEIRADGYEPLTVEVRIEPGRTVTYKGELKKLP